MAPLAVRSRTLRLYGLILAFIAKDVLATDKSELFPMGASCDTLHSADHALLQHREKKGKTQVDDKEALQPLSMSLVATHRNKTARKEMPKKQKKPEAFSKCKALVDLLASRAGLEDAAQLWSFVCEDDSRRQALRRFRQGCLYVPTNPGLVKFYEVVEHPNPWHFINMFEDSFFKATGACPSEVPGATAKSVGDAHVTACASGGGFVSHNNTCVGARFLGTSGSVQIYALNGLIGLDAVWERKLMSEGVEDEVALMERRRRFDDHEAIRKAGIKNRNRSVTIPLKYIVCDPGDKSVDLAVTDEQLVRQTAALNVNFAGKDRCTSEIKYEPHFADTRIRFTHAGIERVTDPNCRMDCTDRFEDIAEDVAPLEDGMIKVTICTSESLGMSAFPQMDYRFAIVAPGTLPGGTISGIDQGDTLTHELGHYFGLMHTFNDGCEGDDHVADTAQEESAFFGCPAAGRWRRTCGSGDPVHNFMDYSDDRCLCSFTRGQVDRIWGHIELYMSDILAMAI